MNSSFLRAIPLTNVKMFAPNTNFQDPILYFDLYRDFSACYITLLQHCVLHCIVFTNIREIP